MNQQPSILVLGATGGIGGETTRQLRDAGWQVKAMKRDLKHQEVQQDGITWIRGDAMNPADTDVAAAGCSVLLHAVNPPGYRNWSGLVLPMLESTLTAARNHHACILMPGTVYNYGPDVFPLITEDAPQQPLTRKGRIRVELEQRLQNHADQGGQVILLRSGDFFGPGAANNWLAQGMIQPGKATRFIVDPNTPGAGHQWAYLPDVAATLIKLLERREQLPGFSHFHFRGHWDEDGRQMVAALQRVVTAHRGKVPKVWRFPWWLVQLASPFNETFAELLEMRYLWQQTLQLDNTRLISLLGQEPHTPLDQALEKTLKSLGCLTDP
ncbi:NAD(P)H-binding protein [Marinospirillum alkaliphilum]|uniref:Nucleoside-diphosphate-sugar epimerase n=1 Tax=Marinospirillum alkaliphilum DSM 21637 TaxID=1122209 RepID=A0A1K1XFX6_9GAMM|nr:NAD(P)H-binding protein [Marinospirillum alkaliphilum]SFX48478.1 Nucleoside-diphosphate-sugar epimerase [Marinospirillum alkaliphilum DSM 21637]